MASPEDSKQGYSSKVSISLSNLVSEASNQVSKDRKRKIEIIYSSNRLSDAVLLRKHLFGATPNPVELIERQEGDALEYDFASFSYQIYLDRISLDPLC